MRFLFRVFLFYLPTNDCSRKRTGKIFIHAGSRRNREDRLIGSREIVIVLFPCSSNILVVGFGKRRRKGYWNDLSES